MKKIALACVLAFALVACAKNDAAKQTGAAVAKIDGTPITQADFEREMGNVPEYAMQLFSDEAGKEKFLNEIINKEVLYREALKKGLDKDPEFQKKVEDFKKLSLVSGLFEKEVMTKAKVSDQDVKNYYDSHKDDFVVTSEIKASHILVKTEGEATKVLERLQKGERFADIAKAASIDKASAKNGGDLGFFKKGQMVPQFEKVAANLKPGEISKPVRTEFGWHIILVTDRKKGPTIEFERVRDMISQKLSAEKQREAFETYVEGLKKTHKIEIDKAALAKIGAPEKGAEMPAEKTGEPKPAPEMKDEKKTDKPKEDKAK